MKLSRQLTTLSLIVAIAAMPATAFAQGGGSSGGSSGGSAGSSGASSGTGGSGTSSGSTGGTTSPGSTLSSPGNSTLGTPNAAPSPYDQSQRYIPGNSNSQNSAGQLNNNNRSTLGSGTTGSSTTPGTGQSPSDLTIMRDPAQPNSGTGGSRTR